MSLVYLRDKLTEVCLRHVLNDDMDVVIPEPYIPYIPERWNGTLVLAESQNLGKRSSGYCAWLMGVDQNTRIRRLGLYDGVGVQPWDDSSLKIALEAALCISAGETAVSNAVLWSQTDERSRNRNPSALLSERSSSLWSEMLQILKVKHIVTAGKIADKVITSALQKSDMQLRHTILRLPSPQALSRISGMFKDADLLRRYPEVCTVIEANPDWVSKQRRNKIFFAYHAVSQTSVKGVFWRLRYRKFNSLFFG